MKIEYKANADGEAMAFVTVWEEENEAPSIEAVMNVTDVIEATEQADALIEEAE